MFVLYTGLGVVLGHNFPFYMQFKGGKGIAASGGMIVGLWDWRLVVILLAAFVISVVITRWITYDHDRILHIIHSICNSWRL